MRLCIGKCSNGSRKVAEYFNKHFTKPKSKLAEMDERKTYVTDPVIHTLSKFKSLPGTPKSFSFFLDPNKSGISQVFASRVNLAKT